MCGIFPRPIPEGLGLAEGAAVTFCSILLGYYAACAAREKVKHELTGFVSIAATSSSINIAGEGLCGLN